MAPTGLGLGLLETYLIGTSVLLYYQYGRKNPRKQDHYRKELVKIPGGEPLEGTDPSYPVYKTGALPLCYSGIPIKVTRRFAAVAIGTEQVFMFIL